jgi:hypothetical protein
MAIVLTCECGRKLQIKEEFAGQQGQCPSCGRIIQIPTLDDPTVPEAAGVHVPEMKAVEVDEDSGERTHTGSSERTHTDGEQGEQEPVQNHGGLPIPDNAEFFAPPPEEIGPVISAHTTLRQGVEPTSMGARLLGGGAAALLGLLIGALIINGAGVKSAFWVFFLCVVPALCAFGIALLATGFTHTCTYIGREGVAKFVCTGSKDNLSTHEVFRFRDAAELRTSTTLRYVNSVYQGTNYSYQWTDVAGRPRYIVSGTHNSEAGNPPSTDPFHFARGAEVAWTIYMLDQTYRQLELSGSVLFNLRDGRWVRVGKDTLALGGQGSEEPVVWDVADIAGIRVHQGQVQIRRVDAKEGWFSSQGIFKFSFDSLANAQLFFHLVEKVAGIRIN